VYIVFQREQEIRMGQMAMGGKELRKNEIVLVPFGGGNKR
jgi:hypothetical protein